MTRRKNTIDFLKYNKSYCEGCGQPRVLNKGNLCKVCNKLKKQGAFNSPY